MYFMIHSNMCIMHVRMDGLKKFSVVTFVRITRGGIFQKHKSKYAIQNTKLECSVNNKIYLSNNTFDDKKILVTSSYIHQLCYLHKLINNNLNFRNIFL